ncbi:uncharacterized protein LOC116305569 [Actinia tenebrosa]|uniref:Uncharacterized protein LOC116305569 n=1 Tax=Actinia tenebrosa TaxID=6105 RepID=A0A6P8IZL4_ACTTE|nr:uncharacterized protein LOC116305569 [Actinia tenebrosa]
MKPMFLLAVVIFYCMNNVFSVPVMDLHPLDLAARVVCEDTRSDCNWISQQPDPGQYCELYKNDPEVKKCAKTCGFCGYKAPAPACEDTRSDCYTINHIGESKATYCARNRYDPAVRECARTCGFC